MIFENSPFQRIRAKLLAASALVVLSVPAALAHDGQMHEQKSEAAKTEMADHSGHTGHGDHATQAKMHDTHSADHATMDHATMDHRMPDHLGMDEGNSGEMAMRPDGFGFKRSMNAYTAPAVTLRDRHGRKVAFAELLEFDGPVLLNFIFTSCATICPVQSATFGQVQPDLAAIEDHYLMVSISIDPEYDTPSRLRDYADLHDARDNWVMLTGAFDDIFQVVRAFDAVYKGENKMYHRPLTFLRANADAQWLRLEGLLGAEELAGEYSKMLNPEVN